MLFQINHSISVVSGPESVVFPQADVVPVDDADTLDEPVVSLLIGFLMIVDCDRQGLRLQVRVVRLLHLSKSLFIHFLTLFFHIDVVLFILDDVLRSLFVQNSKRLSVGHVLLQKVQLLQSARVYLNEVLVGFLQRLVLEEDPVSRKLQVSNHLFLFVQVDALLGEFLRQGIKALPQFFIFAGQISQLLVVGLNDSCELGLLFLGEPFEAIYLFLIELLGHSKMRVGLQFLILMLQLLLFSFQDLDPLLVLMEQLFYLIVLSRVLDDRIANKLLHSFTLVEHFEVDLLVLELVAFLHQLFDSLIGLFQLIFYVLYVLVLDRSRELGVFLGELCVSKHQLVVFGFELGNPLTGGFEGGQVFLIGLIDELGFPGKLIVLHCLVLQFFVEFDFCLVDFLIVVLVLHLVHFKFFSYFLAVSLQLVVVVLEFHVLGLKDVVFLVQQPVGLLEFLNFLHEFVDLSIVPVARLFQLPVYLDQFVYLLQSLLISKLQSILRDA